MIQEKILKIIKGLNTFSLDDVIMMSGIEESEAEYILDSLVSENVITLTNQGFYRYKEIFKQEGIKIKEKSPYVAVNNSDIKFKEASEYFLYNYALQKCTPSTFKTYKSLIKSHLDQFFGKMELKSINQDHLKEYIDLKQQEKLSPKRINSSLTLLGNVFNKCIEWKYISESPYNGIVNIKFSKKSNIRVLCEAEIESLLKVAKSKYPRLYYMILLILSTGIRKGELLALKKVDIDFENRKINVNKTLFEDKIVFPRINNIIREVDTPEKMLSELKKLINKKKQDDFVFDTQGLSHFTQDRQLRIDFSKLVKETGLNNLKFNELRHTYAYNALKSGMSIDYLHKQHGEYSIQATMDKYRDFIPNTSNFRKTS